jgi:hypothetical protein
MSDPAQTPAPSLAVNRLSIHVPAMSAQDAERLAEQVAESLRHWPHAPSASGRIARVDATVQAPQAPTTAGLADQIATAVLEAALRELGQP